MAVTTNYVRNVLQDAMDIAEDTSESFPDVIGLANGGYAVAYIADIQNPGEAKIVFHDAAFNPSPSEEASQGSYIVGSGPALTQLSNGNVLVVWDDHNPGEGPTGRLYTSAGAAIGDEFLLVGGADDMRVAALANGGFALSYTTAGNIFVTRYDSAGIFQSGGQVNTVATTGTQNDSAIALLADGGYVITYTDTNPGDQQIRATIFNADGSVRKADFLIDGFGDNTESKVVGLPNGNWAVVYADSGWGNEGGTTGITMQIFDASGTNVTPGTFIHVNNPDANPDTLPDIAVLSNGFIAVTWTKFVFPNDDLYGRIFDQNGNAISIEGIGTGEFAIMPGGGTTSNSTIAAMADGLLVTAWDRDNPISGPVSSMVSQLVRSSTGDGANDTITGDLLLDVMDGGGGFDFASYSTAQTGLTVSLANPASNTGDAKGDTYISIEGLIGTAFNDTLAGNAANNTLHGGAGDDTALFTGSLASYTIQDFGGPIVVSGPEGTDTLTGIEHLQFANATLTPVDDGNPLFDVLFYLSRNPDVFAAGVDPLAHFNASGWHEGRDPNALFDSSGYLAVNTDVAAAGVNPLNHYHQNGWHEGRDPSAWFDTTLYLINNPDVAAAGIDPLAHYLANGFSEGRSAYAAVGAISGGFDAQYYLFHNPDVAAAGVDALAHYNLHGWQEGRNPNAFFDSAGYLSHYADVAAAGVNPLQHFQLHGWQEGRDPSASFDTQGYLAANPDVAAAGINPLDHYLQHGIYEGRQAVNDGVWG